MARQRLDLTTVIGQAALVVDSVGRDELSLGRVAADLGVQPSALYNHVDGLDGMLHGLALHATQHLGSRLTDASIARSGDVALGAIGHAYRAFAHDHPGQYEFTLLPPTESSLNDAHAAIVQIFVRLMHSYELDGDEAVHTARVVRSAIHGFVSLESIDAFPSPQDADASFDRLIEFIADGIRR
jgi:AcrR family transcriptional regulator